MNFLYSCNGKYSEGKKSGPAFQEKRERERHKDRVAKFAGNGKWVAEEGGVQGGKTGEREGRRWGNKWAGSRGRGAGGGGEGQLWFEEKVKHLLDKPLVALTY